MTHMSHFLKEARKGAGGWSQSFVLSLDSQATEQLLFRVTLKPESMSMNMKDGPVAAEQMSKQKTWPTYPWEYDLLMNSERWGKETYSSHAWSCHSVDALMDRCSDSPQVKRPGEESIGIEVFSPGALWASSLLSMDRRVSYKAE